MTGLECIALTVFLESRGEPSHGQKAVASVIWNRVEHRAWPKDPCSVIKQKRQFAIPSKSETEAFRRNPNKYLQIAEFTRTARTTSATYFMRHDAAWQPKNRKFLMRIGDHLFYE